MSLATDLEIHKQGTALLDLCADVQAEVFSAGNSYLGLVRQASHSHKERAALCRALLKRGHPVEGLHLSKAFSRSATA